MTESDFTKFFLLETSLENIKPHINEPKPAVEKQPAADAKIIPLPEPGLLPDVPVNFLELAELRASVRQYNEASISLQQLSFLLWCTQGIKMVLPEGITIRNVPSAGASHAFETYLLIQRVDGLEPGLYRFLAVDHALEAIKPGDNIIDEVYPFFTSKKMVQTSAVTFLWAADYKRMAYKYSMRAIRYLYLDAGHVCQNLYLASYVQKLGACAIGSFYDDALNSYLGFDGENDFVVYGASVGKA